MLFTLIPASCQKINCSSSILHLKRFRVTSQGCEGENMELKNYQKKSYSGFAKTNLHSLKARAPIIAEAWKNYWQTKDIAVGNGGVPAYKE